MIDTQDTEADLPRRDHSLKAGDTPALGLPYVPGSGGKRWASPADLNDAAGSALEVGDDVLWHDRLATVADVFPGLPWQKAICRLQFEDGGPSLPVARDELQLVEGDGARYFVSLVNPDLDHTAPLPSPVPRRPTTGSLEETQETPRIGAVELDDEDARPTTQLDAVVPAAHVGAFAGVWLGLLDLLRLIGAFFAWPFRRDGGRALGNRIIDLIAAGIDASADWEHTHARQLARIAIGALSALILAGAGVGWAMLELAR